MINIAYIKVNFSWGSSYFEVLGKEWKLVYGKKQRNLKKRRNELIAKINCRN